MLFSTIVNHPCNFTYWYNWLNICTVFKIIDYWFSMLDICCVTLFTAGVCMLLAIKTNLQNYHCNAKCGVRFKAADANRLFSSTLKKLLPKPGMTEVFKLVLEQELRAKSRGQKEVSKKVQGDLQKANTELANARRLLLTGEIEPSEYKAIKAEYEKKMEHQTVQFSNFPGSQKILMICLKGPSSRCLRWISFMKIQIMK